MGCGCGGKKFTGSGTSAARMSSSTLRAPAPSTNTTVVQATGVKLGTAPAIQPMVRKTV